jgi:hypothetical protein
VPTFILTANELQPDCEVDPTVNRYVAKGMLHKLFSMHIITESNISPLGYFEEQNTMSAYHFSYIVRAV